MEEFSEYLKLQISQSIYLKVVLCFLFSFIVSYLSIPKILEVSKLKKLNADVNERSSHVDDISNLGGIAIFFATLICSTIFAPQLANYIFLFASLFILFFIGLLDDLLVVSPNKKLLAQIIVGILITIGADIRIENFFGVFGVYQLSYWFSIVFTCFTFIAIINAYNLIDGIDGLGGGVATLASSAFCLSFLKVYDYPLTLLGASLLGSVIAFLRFNLSKKNKIFMGDTGSMFIGFILSFMAIRLIHISSLPHIDLNTSPVFAVAILIVPIVDTMNVFSKRIINGKSPFSADKQHVHHKLLELGLSHYKSSAIIISVNLIIILTAYCLRHSFKINTLMLIVVGMGFVASFIPNIILRIKDNNK